MLNWLKRLADRYLAKYTLIVGPGNIQCGRCHLWADPQEPRHLTIPPTARGNAYADAVGCGAQWRMVTKRYLAQQPWPAPGEPDPLDTINRRRQDNGLRQLVRIDVPLRPLPDYYEPGDHPHWDERLRYRRNQLTHAMRWVRRLHHRPRVSH